MDADLVLNGLLIHIFGVGVPCVLCVRAAHAPHLPHSLHAGRGGNS